MRYIGVDLHKTQFSVCWIGVGGSDKFERYPMNAEGLSRFREKLDSGCEVGVEATGNSKYFYDQIVGSVKKVRVINPLQFKIINKSVKKTDKEDSRVITEFLSKELLPEVREMNKERRELKSLIQIRDKLVKLRSSLKNKIHGILLEQRMIGSLRILIILF